MFAEFLINETWQTVMPGVSACILEGGKKTGPLPMKMEYAHAEVFFCLGGSMTIQRPGGPETTVEQKEILLLSNQINLLQAEVTAPLEGIFLKVDQQRNAETFRELCRSFGDLKLTMRQAGEQLQAGGGFRVVPVSPWTRGFFYALRKLSSEEQARYCMIKTFELLYLMCNQETESTVCQCEHGGMMSVAAGMKSYMEAHMDEKLTITEISHRFHLSRTACKSAFRACYGQPIHSWLLDRRMEKAAELLEKTKMPILQVAQSVGYTGVSQFNVAFRQRYGKSPREFRKMSLSAAF